MLTLIFRGRLCEILLATRDPRMFERHAIIYDLGLVKIGTITDEGREIAEKPGADPATRRSGPLSDVRHSAVAHGCRRS